MKKTLIVICVLMVLLGGYFFIYQQANSKLKLAELKSDLDGMYNPLQTLAMLQVPSAKIKLETISEAIVVREQMLRSLADHDHELAVIQAGALLNLFPQHTDAIRVLRESGRIFYLLRSALVMTNESLISEEPDHADFDTIAFINNNDWKEDRQRLVKYIQNGLQELGYYTGDVDGDAGEETQEAIAEFMEKHNSNISDKISMEMASAISRELALKQETKLWREKRFHNINKARELAEKAVDLDSHFNRAVKLEQILDQTHEMIALMMSEQVIKKGVLIFTLADAYHSGVLGVLNSAASSRYTSINDAYKLIEPILDKAGQSLGHWQSEIDENMTLISTYKGERSKEYFSSLKSFVQTVRMGKESLLVPTGNLPQYRNAGDDAIREFKRMRTQLVSLQPNSAEIDESFDGYITIFSEYQLFQDPETEKIIDKHSDLFSA